jgi:hypothetical protein
MNATEPARRGPGRPRKRDTKLTRLPADLVAMLSAVSWWDRTFVVADFLDPLVRKAIEKRFDSIPAEFRETALKRVTPSR